MGARWKLWAINTPAGLISQITDRSYDPAIDPVLLKGDGRLTPHFAGVMEQKPSVTFTTEAIKSVLDTIGLGFYGFSAAVDLYYAKFVSGGGMAASGHGKLSGTLGCFYPIELSAQQGGTARLQVGMYWIVADGTTPPVARSVGVTLPALTSSEGYTLGPASINGTALTEIESLRVRFNYRIQVRNHNGNVYPHFAYYDGFAPEVSVGLKDPDQSYVLGMGGVAQGATASKFFFRKKAPGGPGNVADLTTAHIKLTVAAGFHRPDPTSESENDESAADLVAHAIDDGTNSVLGINTASAVS